MKQKGLGAGLGALFGDSAIDAAPGDFEYVPIQMIEPRQEQPRTVFEQEKIDELADSIREHGVMSPLTVRSIDGGYYQIIAGERRWRAARASGLAEIPVRIVVADDRKATELALVENLQREDLSPVEEARAYKTLIEEFGMTQDDIAQSVSKSRPAVANTLRLLALPPAIMPLLESGDLSAGSARALLALKNESAMLSAAQMAIRGDLNVREVEALVKKMCREEPCVKNPPGDEEVNYLLDAATRLESALGRRVAIRQGRDKGKGRIELEYYDQDDFDALFDALSAMPRPVRKG